MMRKLQGTSTVTMFAQKPGVETASDVATEVSARSSAPAGNALRAVLAREERVGEARWLPHTNVLVLQRAAAAASARSAAGSSMGRPAIFPLSGRMVLLGPGAQRLAEADRGSAVR
mmetsp:Transcript_88149/g.273862  ORF Transcript_88149/g.273862 Transcript_88149/m.273862 type:complete len:116 (-) Transcript_88149:13-360(-)